jgi:polo-like kinase 1
LYKRDNKGNIIRGYHKGDSFGKGGFSTCYKVYLKENKKIFIAKEIEYNEAKLKEAIIHASLRNNNIVKLYDYFECEKNEKLYLILEFCENRDLSDLVKKRSKLTEIEVQYYIRNLINALKYLHEEKNIVHCDLKPGNIFLTDKLEVKLGDFGLAKRLTSDHIPANNGGTIHYMAPESFKKSKCSYKIDIWAVGVIMYYLLTGEPPFTGDKNNKNEIETKINLCKYDYPQDIVISKIAKDLIRQILKKDPNERPTLNQIFLYSSS